MIQEETLQFYRELRQNNNKEWFDQNRTRYQKAKDDYHGFVAQLLEGMQKVDPGLKHLQVKDCIFRINRDVRFSNDKRPYKTHMGMILTQGGRKLEHAGYYVHLDEDEGSFAGGGIWMPTSEVLKKIRREVAAFHDDLTEIISAKEFKKQYGELEREEGTVLSRPPKGYNESDPAIEYLKLKSFTASKALPVEILHDKNSIKKLIEILSALTPLLTFLNRAFHD